MLAMLLLGGFTCNLLIQPVHPKYYMEETPTEKVQETTQETSNEIPSAQHSGLRSNLCLILSWGAVTISLGWGVYVTLQKAWKLFL